MANIKTGDDTNGLTCNIRVGETKRKGVWRKMGAWENHSPTKETGLRKMKVRIYDREGGRLG